MADESPVNTAYSGSNRKEKKSKMKLPENVELSTIEEIYEFYGERVLNLIFRMVRNEETARDLTQDIFLKVFQNLEKFKNQSQLYTWIYRIAVNHTLNYLKREKRRRRMNFLDRKVGDILTEKEPEADIPDRNPDSFADTKMERSEREKIIWRIIHSLPIKYKIPMVLYRYEEMSYKEISESMELSLSAVEARLHRGRKQLIDKLEPWLTHL